MGRKRKGTSACPVGASCKVTPTRPVVATAESNRQNPKSGSTPSSISAGASCKATTTPPVAATERKRRDHPESGGSPSIIWTAPKKGQLKLNFDGSCYNKKRSKLSSIGGVYRDHRGKFVLGYAQSIGRSTSGVAELVALKTGLELALENGWRDISIEGDFKRIVDVIEGRSRFQTKSSLEQYTEIAAMLAQLGETTVSYVPRQGNRAANCFAKLGHKEAVQRLWRDIPPRQVRPCLKIDTPKVHCAAKTRTI